MNTFTQKLLIIAFILAAIFGCTNNNPFGNEREIPGMPDPMGGGGGGQPGQADASGNDLQFEVSLSSSDDASFLAYKETSPTDEADRDYEDFVETESFKNTVTIVYDGESATCTGADKNIKVEINGADVVVTSSKKAEYILTGKTENGSFKINKNENKDDNKKAKVVLKDVSLKSTTQAAINIQSGKRCYLVLDGESYIEGACIDPEPKEGETEAEDMKAAIFSEGKLLMSGTGHLSIKENNKHGICSDDYVFLHSGIHLDITSAKDGIHANDSIVISGAEVNITAGKDGIDSENDIVMNGGVVRATITSDGCKGMKSDRDISLYGGRIAVVTSGDVDTSDSADPKGCAGIKCDGVLNIDGAVLALKSTGQGGKGISVDEEFVMNSGLVQVITTGSRYGSSSNGSGPGGGFPGGGFGGGMGNPGGGNSSSESVSPKGIRCDNNITINGGKIQIIVSGENDGAEGLESKASLTINDGTVEIYAYDDAINAATSITVNGGNIYTYSASNDAIDSNGTLNLKGGVIIASGATTPEEAFDTDNGRNFSICGGTIIGTGGTQVEPQGSNTQSFCRFSYNMSKGTLLTLLDKDGNHVFSYNVPRAASAGIISANAMNNGYSIYSGGSVKNGTAFHGATIGGTFDQNDAQKLK